MCGWDSVGSCTSVVRGGTKTGLGVEECIRTDEERDPILMGVAGFLEDPILMGVETLVGTMLGMAR